MKFSAMQLFSVAFPESRQRLNPRSDVYRAGLLAHLRYPLAEQDNVQCPYRQGTTEHDAWIHISLAWR